MHRLTVCSLTTLGSVLALAACRHHAGARHGRGADLDRDHDEHQLRDGDADHDEHGDEAHPELGAGISTKRALHAIAKARCEREQRLANLHGQRIRAHAELRVDRLGIDQQQLVEQVCLLKAR
jgi:hypothetical protein